MSWSDKFKSGELICVNIGFGVWCQVISFDGGFAMIEGSSLNFSEDYCEFKEGMESDFKNESWVNGDCDE